MESSILDSLGVEIIGVMFPVSICMCIVVLIVYTLSAADPNVAASQIRTAANLVYLENPSDSTSEKLEGVLLNALVLVVIIAIATFVIVLLYYYNFTNFLKNYMRFSAFVTLSTMGGPIFLSVIQHFSIPVDAITFFLFLFNFTIVGVLSLFSGGVPIVIRQVYMVVIGIIVAAWFTKMPEWTTWGVLVALATYDLVAVLAPGGPLKMLVELASSRNEELPAFIYESRPTVVHNRRQQGSNLQLLVGGVSDSGSVELQAVSTENINRNERENHIQTSTPSEIQDFENTDEAEDSPLVDRYLSSRPQNENVDELSPLVELMGMEQGREEEARVDHNNNNNNNDTDSMIESRDGIKLGLGDFIFYSVLVGRAAMYDLMTVYACYLGIISGLGCTLILLPIYKRALPALPISILLGVFFYFLTRLLMEPFVVGIATNLMMF